MSTAAHHGRESPSHWNQQGRPTDSQYPPPATHPSQAYGNYHLPPQQSGYPAQSPYQPNSQTASAQQQQQHHDMVTLPPPPQVQDGLYRQPPMQAPSYDAYGQQPPPMGYAAQPAQQQVTFNQPAPRQRTAIACRYCRRRKIRCHGFDQNPEGRCSNCTRFNQECIFTPVSSQTHAFVPAHTAYPHLRNQGRFPQAGYAQQSPPLYGPHGQPLGPVPAPQHAPDSSYPPPPGPHQPYGAPAPYPTMPPGYDTRTGAPAHPPQHDDPQVSSKRQRTTEAGAYYSIGRVRYDSPLSPPHQEDKSSYFGQHRRQSGAYDTYPDPTPHMAPISPVSSNGYPNAPYSNNNYYANPPPPAPAQPGPGAQRRASPPGSYGFDRTSTSPHSTHAGPGGPHGHIGSYPGNLHPPQVLPPANDVRNHSPAGQGRESGRPGGGMSVRDMLDNSQSQGGRSNTDSNMLNQLNRRAP